MLFNVAQLLHYCEFRVEHAFSNESFSRPWFDRLTAIRVLSCTDITCFSSALVTFSRRFNANFKNEDNNEGLPIKSFLQTASSPLTQNIDETNQALKLLLVTGVHLVLSLDL